MTTTQSTPARSASKLIAGTDFKVADLSLHTFGRKEIDLAEHEMPGLMALRDEVRGSRSRSPARASPARCT